MAELDDRLLRDLARLRTREGPPRGVEDRVLAALQTAIAGGPTGGGSGGSPGGGSPAPSTSIDLLFGTKVITATAAMTCAGLLLVKLTAIAVQAGSSAGTEVAKSVAEPRATAPEPAPIGPEPALAPTLTEIQRPPVRPRSDAVTRVVSEPNGDPLAAELALLEQARATTDADERLGLLARHRDRFPSGILAAERDALRIASLCELERLAEARTAFEQFVASHARSPLRARIRSACPLLDP